MVLILTDAQVALATNPHEAPQVTLGGAASPSGRTTHYVDLGDETDVEVDLASYERVCAHLNGDDEDEGKGSD